MTHFFLGQIARQAVKVDAQTQRIDRPETLSQKRPHSAGQDITRASAGHTGIAGEVDVDTARRLCDETAEALESDVNCSFGSEGPNRLQPVALDIGSGASEKSRRFSGVRGQEDGAAGWESWAVASF